MPNKGTPIILTEYERKLVESCAELYGVEPEQAVEMLISQAIARRMKRKTGKTPAKVYPIRKH